MILLADSGSTGTDWVLIHDGQTRAFTTIGMHPRFLDEAMAETQIFGSLPDQTVRNAIPSVFFYGSGCLRPEQGAIISRFLQPLFPSAVIEVRSDLEGAALGSLGPLSGIVAILGTGSSSALWDGSRLSKVTRSLGYLLGDEGSGADLGRHFLSDILMGRVPEEIRRTLPDEMGREHEPLLNELYASRHPGRHLATYARLLAEHTGTTYVQELLRERFRAFILNQLLPLSPNEAYPLSFIGSIAFYFREALTAVCRESGLQEPMISRSPMDGLIQHYTGQGIH